jgi:hypothetical protein
VNLPAKGIYPTVVEINMKLEPTHIVVQNYDLTRVCISPMGLKKCYDSLIVSIILQTISFRFLRIGEAI